MTAGQTSDRILAMQYAVVRILAGAGTLEEICAQTVRAICASLGWKSGEMWTFDEQAGGLRAVATWHAPSHRLARFAAATRAMTMNEATGLGGRIWKTVEPQWVPDVLNDEQFLRIASAREAGLHAALGFPLVSGAQACGVMVFFNDSEEASDPQLLDVIRALGGQIGEFIVRKRAEEALQRSAHRLRELSRRLVEVQEDERRRLAEELHDRVGQSLTALNINLDVIAGQLPADVLAKVGPRLADARQLVETAIENTRQVMTELHPAVLDYGLLAALHWFGESFSRRTGIEMSIVGRDPVPALAPALADVLFRIAQEALTNVAKYARATRVQVAIETIADKVRLTVEDDGCGFDARNATQRGVDKGWGIMLMRERAAAVGGSLKVESAADEGTRVIVEVSRA